MIPKVIHYCWFGKSEKSELVIKCIESWKKYCPDFKIIEWNEETYDVTKNKYMYQAYQMKRWGFVTDYVRLDVVYRYGGIYLDTDVELVRSIDELLETEGFIGFEKTPGENLASVFVNTGQGFGAVAFHSAVKEMLDVYDRLIFMKEGEENLKTCPYYNTEALVKLGLKQVNTYQDIDGFRIYPTDYFCPINWKTQKCEMTQNTYSIHHFNASWLSAKEKRKRKRYRKIDYVIHLPNMILKAALGKRKYEWLKMKIRGNR